MNVPCFKCGKALEAKPCIDNRVIVPLYDGRWFRATGNYGSTIFDPTWDTGQFMQLAICDDCARDVPIKVHGPSATLADGPTDTNRGKP